LSSFSLSLTCSVFALVAIHQAPETRSCKDAAAAPAWITRVSFDAERAAQIVATPKSRFAGYVYLAVRPLSFA